VSHPPVRLEAEAKERGKAIAAANKVIQKSQEREIRAWSLVRAAGSVDQWWRSMSAEEA
jgi:hypothetical protein